MISLFNDLRISGQTNKLNLSDCQCISLIEFDFKVKIHVSLYEMNIVSFRY